VTTVFLSGSRKVSRLPDPVVRRLDNIISCGFDVVTGDANGADKAMQRYLAEENYPKVKVFFVGDAPRNNLGGWDQERVDVPPGYRGRDFYAQKDKFMASMADFGLVVWDGKSPGSVQNMLWLVENCKKGIVFHNPTRSFVKIRIESDLMDVFQLTDGVSMREIDRKIGLPPHLMKGFGGQSELEFG